MLADRLCVRESAGGLSNSKKRPAAIVPLKTFFLNLPDTENYYDPKII